MIVPTVSLAEAPAGVSHAVRRCSSTMRCSATAMLRRVRSIASTFTEIESMPHRTSRSAYSACVDGACPQIEQVSPSRGTRR